MKLALILEQIADACLVLDNIGRVILVNEPAARLFARPVKELLGAPLPAQLPNGFPIHSLCDVAASGRRPASAHHFARDSQRWYYVRASPAGDWIVVFCFEVPVGPAEDIAAIEERLARLAAQLGDATRELESLSYAVSHDLRAPLRHIEAFSSLLEGNLAGKLDSDTAEYIAIISQSAKQMSKLLDGVLSYSRLCRRELNRTAVSLDQALKSALQDLRLEAEGRQVEWEISPLPEIQGDPWMIRESLYQLLSNALKFTRAREPARICVSATAAPGEIVVRIQDNGIGFDVQYGDRLFNLFQKLHSDPKYEGAGIGLAHVRRMIQRQGGRVWAEGKPDAGATFYIALPN
ncbi:MAG: ATP-binding protein [Verrucomicrobia subdivision 3 bacterium]|nr:ATP-binding protein [Limisphaerales bacterium]